MKKRNYYSTGFTLIELLVVISIIGLLSTMAVISLNNARAKARDAKRLSDVKNMSSTLNVVAIDNNSVSLVGCVNDNDSTLLCAGGNPENIDEEFVKYVDPSFDVATANANACQGGGVSCQYSIMSAGSTVGDATIQFYLEKGTDEIPAGDNTITHGVFNE